jgi:STE24 endopeptidase
MNWIAVFIVVAIAGELLLSALADLLNRKSMQTRLPAEFAGWYDPDHYRKAQQYQIANIRFSWMTTVVNYALLMGMWFGRGFALLDQWVRSWDLPTVPAGLLFVGSLGLLVSAVSIPLRLYRTFVIEERFGFNRTTWGTFVVDQIKGLVLAVLLGTPLLAGILAFFAYAGPMAWLYCWLAVALYMLIVQFVAPTWIMPLFNKFTPLEKGNLREAILSYARSIGFPLKNVFVMDGSRRSAKSNAFFTGFGHSRRIVLFDTLVENHSTAELVAILAHEMGHYRKKHIFWSLIAGILHAGLMFYLLSLLIEAPGLYEAFYVQTPSIYTGLVFFAFLFAPVEFFAGILIRMLSRRNEYQADRFSVETTGDPRAMIDALKRLSVRNLSNLLPHRLTVFLNYSHPPVLDRIRAIAGAVGGPARPSLTAEENR